MSAVWKERVLPDIRERDRIVVMGEPFDIAKVKVTKLPGLIEIWKPASLWWAIGSEWIDWCRTESFAVNAMNHAYRLSLDTSRLKRPIHVIHTRSQVIEFERRYGTSRYEGLAHGIDWSKVAEDYSAIEVHEPRHLHYENPNRMWLSTWDVSSGCLWDPTLIMKVEEVAIPEQREER